MPPGLVIDTLALTGTWFALTFLFRFTPMIESLMNISCGDTVTCSYESILSSSRALVYALRPFLCNVSLRYIFIGLDFSAVLCCVFGRVEAIFGVLAADIVLPDLT